MVKELPRSPTIPTETLLKRKLILRRHAERYILITLLTFALTVGATSMFLNLTGFPQLGRRQPAYLACAYGAVFSFLQRSCCF